MHKVKFPAIPVILLVGIVVASPLFDASAGSLAQTSPTLGDAASYSVLGATTVTNTGDTTMPGDLGVSPGTAVTGFPPGTVGGTIHAGDADAAEAQVDNTAAFGSLDQDCTTDFGAVSQDLAGLTLDPGVYCANDFALSGDLTLNGSGVWIFKAATTLITSPGSSVIGGDACDVWWRVGSSATVDTNTSFIGNILASESITLKTGASLDGRALAQNGAVTLDTNTIDGSTCLPSAATATATVTSTATATATPTATPTATATATLEPATATAAALTATATATLEPATATAAALTATATTTLAPPTATAAALTGTAAALAAPNTTPIAGLPDTGGAPIADNIDRRWGLVIAAGFTAMILFVGVRRHRRTH